MHGVCALLTREHVPQHGEPAPAAFVEKGQYQGCGSHLLPERPLGHLLVQVGCCFRGRMYFKWLVLAPCACTCVSVCAALPVEIRRRRFWRRLPDSLPKWGEWCCGTWLGSPGVWFDNLGTPGEQEAWRRVGAILAPGHPPENSSPEQNLDL